jgi:putative inorganic carbon (hco3(-)) transporter
MTLGRRAVDSADAAGAVATNRYRLSTALCALTCLLAPTYIVRWHYGFYPTTLLEHVVALCVVVYVVEAIRYRDTMVWRSPYLIPGLLFLLAGALAVWSAPGRSSALGLYRAYLVEPMAFAFVVVNVVRTPSRALLVASGLFLGGLGVGLANSFVVLEAIRHHTYQVTETPPVVVYLTANAVSLYVDPLAALAGALALHGSGRTRLVGAIAFAASIPVEILSFSRGGWLAFAVVVAGLALSHRRRLVLLPAAVAGGAALALVPPIRQRALIELRNAYGSTVDSRLELWTGTIRLIRARPLFGAGLAGFPERSAPYIRHFRTAASFIDPHNIVLNFWVETGLLGLLAMAWIIGGAIVLCARGWALVTEAWRPYQLGVLLAMVAVVVHGLVDVPYFKNDLSLEFWALLAVAWAGRVWGSERRSSSAS